MKTAILGTGVVGQTIATKLHELGHHVMIGTRDVTETLAVTKPNPMTGTTFNDWHMSHTKIELGTFAQAAAFAHIVFNALNGGGTVAAFKSCNAADLDGKIIIDISNPLDFSKGFPPFLMDGLNNTNSLGEELQKTLPNAKVVKTLNTMTAMLMTNPAMLAGNHTNFICGNDADAKAEVIKLLHQFGWSAANILDLGDITNARGTEAILPIWLRIYGALKTGIFNFGIVKQAQTPQ